MGCHRVTVGRTRGSVWGSGKVSSEGRLCKCALLCLPVDFALGSPHQKKRQGLDSGFAWTLLGVSPPPPPPRWGRVWCRLDPHFSRRFPPFAPTLSSSNTVCTGLSVKLPRSGDDVLPKSNSESHRGPRLCPWNGDTAREVQKERFPGHITGRLWLSASYHHTHNNKHGHTHAHTLWGILCLQPWLISLPLQTYLFGTRLISFWRHLSARFALCGILITLHGGAVLLS